MSFMARKPQCRKTGVTLGKHAQNSRNWSAADHSRFSSVAASVSFSDGAIQFMKNGSAGD